jgi:conjugative transfer signal peptidase TraF
MAGAAVLLVLAETGALPIRLVYNVSPSAPLGFYWVSNPLPLRRGELVLARLPWAWQDWAAGRGYIGDNVPLIKRITALAGDHVCTRGSLLLINNRVAAAALDRDASGAFLPRWHGCRPLQPGEAFLLMADSRGSFDSRYFGPLRSNEIIGRLRPLGWLGAP